MGNAKGPRFEEPQIPSEITRRAPSLASLAGILAPGRDMVIHFAIELTRGANEIPAYTPLVAGGRPADPLIPTEPPLSLAHGRCKKIQASHKRQTDQPMSFRLSALTYIWFAFSAGVAGAWGDLAAHPSSWPI